MGAAPELYDLASICDSQRVNSDSRGKTSHLSAMPPLEQLRKRRDFLRAAKGKKVHCDAFTLQSVQRELKSPYDKEGSMRGTQGLEPDVRAMEGAPDADSALSCGGTSSLPARFGFTVTKKTGHAVKRNRMRRRLKEALRHLTDLPARPDHDYVIIARPAVLSLPFSDLQAALRQALLKVGRAKSHKAKASAPQALENIPAEGSKEILPRCKQPAIGKTPRGRSNP